MEDGEELATGHVPAARGRVRPRNLLVGGEPGRQRRGGARLADGKVHARGPVAVINYGHACGDACGRGCAFDRTRGCGLVAADSSLPS